MASTIVIGDGPGGLSAALFLAKKDHPVTVYGGDETAMHWAHLHNFLGLSEIGGTEFQVRAKAQVTEFGAELVHSTVTAVTADGDGFTVTTDDGSAQADYLVIAGGKAAGSLAESLGIEVTKRGVDTDRDGRTSVDRVYVVGRLAKTMRSQAIISAGMGAAAALDILAREAGKDVTDWDTPPKDAA